MLNVIYLGYTNNHITYQTDDFMVYFIQKDIYSYFSRKILCSKRIYCLFLLTFGADKDKFISKFKII